MKRNSGVVPGEKWMMAGTVGLVLAAGEGVGPGEAAVSTGVAGMRLGVPEDPSGMGDPVPAPPQTEGKRASARGTAITQGKEAFACLAGASAGP